MSVRGVGSRLPFPFTDVARHSAAVLLLLLLLLLPPRLLFLQQQQLLAVAAAAAAATAAAPALLAAASAAAPSAASATLLLLLLLPLLSNVLWWCGMVVLVHGKRRCGGVAPFLLALTATWPKHSLSSATHKYPTHSARRRTRSSSTKRRLSSTTARGGWCALLAHACMHACLLVCVCCVCAAREPVRKLLVDSPVSLKFDVSAHECSAAVMMHQNCKRTRLVFWFRRV